MTRRRPCPAAPRPLEEYAARFDDLFGRLAQRRGFREYLAGLLAPRDRNKTLTALAGAEPVTGAQQPAVQRLQFFLSESRWDPERVSARRLELLQADPATAPHEAGVLVIDDSGDRKDGTKTAHVGRQWLGQYGKTDNGVVTVTTLWADERVYYPVHAVPCTPARHFAKGKNDPAFRTKRQIGTDLAVRARAAGFAFRAVVADSDCGDQDGFRRGLTEAGLPFVMALRPRRGTWARGPEAYLPVDSARALAWDGPDGPGEWSPVTRMLRDGHVDTWWAADATPGWQGPDGTWRLVVATADPATLPEEATWYLVTSLPRPGGPREADSPHPAAGPAEVVRIYAIRNWIEPRYKHVKDELGWADFQVRSDTAIRRHQALVNCALSFCWAAWFAGQLPRDAPGPRSAPGRGEWGAARRVTAAPTTLATDIASGTRLGLPLDRIAALVAGMVDGAPASAAASPDQLRRGGPDPRGGMPRSSDVVGRDAELASVARFLGRPSAGCAGLLLVGEAGIGKSTVWAEAVAAARSRSLRVLACRCAQPEAKLSFSALGDLLGPVLDEGVLRLPPPQARALDVAMLRADPADDALDTRAVCLGVLSAMRELSMSCGVLLAIDDIQWLDVGTAGILEFALRRLETEPVAVVASLRRPSGGGLPLDLGRVLPAGVTRVPLGPLPLAAITKILRDQAMERLSAPVIWRISQACGGNPFYAVELARELQAHGAEPGPGEPLSVPASLARLVEERLVGLPDAARDLLLLAAAAPHPTVAMLSRACLGRPVVSLLQPALDRGIAEIGGETIRFAHPLWASAAYSAAAASARQQAHRRLAAVCSDAEERARHLALAAEQPSEEVAAALSEAARLARSRGAAQAAAECAAMAARLTPGRERRWDRQVAAADYLFSAGDAAGASRLLDVLVAELPAGPVRARARVGRIRTFDENQAAISMLEDALEDARGEAQLQAEIHQTMAWLCDFDLSEGLRHADAAVAVLAGEDAPALLAGALGAKLWLEFLLGKGLRLDLARRAAALEQRARPARAVDGGELPLGALLKSADRLDEARAKLEGVLAAAARDQDESSRFEVGLELGHLECLAGRWPLAERYAIQAAEFVELTGQEELRPLVLGLTALVDSLHGRLDSARAQATEGLRRAEASRSTWSALMILPVLGFIELSAGWHAEAVAYLARADAICERIGLREPGRFRFHADYAEALIACGELEQAAAVLSRFTERGHALGRPWAMATAARCQAMLMAAGGDLAAASSQVEVALARHEQLAMPFELARTLLVGGQVHRRARQKKPAKHMMSQAEADFTSLGAAAWAARARDGLSRLGIRAPAPLELTATERQVAHLAAIGMTNREISERLFISRRTTEANLSRVYRKLGVRSRAELARDFAASGPGTER